MNRRSLALIALSLALSGCGQARQPPNQEGAASSVAAAPSTAGESVSPTVGPPSTPRPSPESVGRSVDLYFTSGGKLSPVPAEVSGATPARQSLDQLLKGPKDPRHSTEIPASTQIEEVSITGGTASVSFNDAFFAPNGATGTLLRLAQVVYTVTQFSGVTSVRFLKNGQAVDLIGEGFPLNRPLSRQDFSQVAAVSPRRA